MTGNILVLSERKNAKLDSITFELLTKSREIADQWGTKLAVLLIGHNLDSLSKSLMTSGVDTVLVADHPILDNGNTETYIQVISDAVRDFKAGLCLLGYTYLGIEVGAAVATRLGAPMISNCVDLELVDEEISVARPMFNGTVHTKVKLEGEHPYIISFEKGVFPKKTLPAKVASVLPIPIEIVESTIRTKVISLLRTVTGEIDITKADIVVGVGRGIRDKTNIQLVKDLADVLGGVVACSRPLVDLGWFPPEILIGISGNTVTPKAYIACGISGASQHVSAMRDSNTIIAINKDPDAPIFQIAHYGIVGDLFEVVPALIEEARKTA